MKVCFSRGYSGATCAANFAFLLFFASLLLSWLAAASTLREVATKKLDFATVRGQVVIEQVSIARQAAGSIDLLHFI